MTLPESYQEKLATFMMEGKGEGADGITLIAGLLKRVEMTERNTQLAWRALQGLEQFVADLPSKLAELDPGLSPHTTIGQAISRMLRQFWFLRGPGTNSPFADWQESAREWELRFGPMPKQVMPLESPKEPSDGPGPH